MVLTCSICLADFSRSDNIWSTTCGHIFHEPCMNDWRSRNQPCPECRTSNIQVHKIFLNLEDESTLEIQKTELHKKLEEAVKVNSEIDARLKESDNNYLSLQMENSVLIEENRNLTIQLKDSDTNFMSLQLQFSKLSDEIKNQAVQLDQRIVSESTLEADLNEKENEVLILKLECSKLREDVRSLQSQLERNVKEKSELELRANEYNIHLNSLQKDFDKATELLKNMNIQMINMRKGNSSDNQQEQAEIARLSLENQNLNTKLNELKKKLISLEEDNEILEQKLKCVKLRLEQEIQDAVSASCVKVKRESLPEKNYDSQQKNDVGTGHSNNKKNISKNNKKTIPKQDTASTPTENNNNDNNTDAMQSSHLQPNPPKKYGVIGYNKNQRKMSASNRKTIPKQGTAFNPKEHSQTRLKDLRYYNDMNAMQLSNLQPERCVSVYGFIKEDMECVFDVLLKNLATQMEILDWNWQNEVENVYTLPNKKGPNLMTTLVIIFKSNECQSKFLENRDKLKASTALKHITILEFFNKETNYLLKYAKSLKDYGYEKVFVEKNTVIAQRNAAAEKIKIFNKEQVDEMKKE